jgi:hypothetical protein
MNNLLRTGDLIAASPLDETASEWSEAIMASAKRNVHRNYDHVGMLELCPDGRILVWNANPLLGVAAEEISDFIQREHAESEKIFDVFRVTEAVDFEQVIQKMQPLLGLSYNFSYVKSEEAYYCSDLIARTFPEKVFPAQPMRFAGEFWLSYYERLGMAIPERQPGTNPNDMLAQDNIDFIGNLRGYSSDT